MSKKSPNVLVFFCDQLRIDLLGSYGGSLVRTPNIDALAEESAVFERAYTPTAICSPARASLITGLYPHGHHMFNNSTPPYSYCEHLREDITTLQGWADRETDYETAYFGKWHIGPAEDLFCSEFHHTHPRPYEGGPKFLNSSHWHPNESLGNVVKSPPIGRAGLLDIKMDEFPDVKALQYTEEFIGNRDDKRPFLAFCSFPGPHSPWMVPEEFGLRYKSSEIPLWTNRRDTLKGKPLYQKKIRLMDQHRSQASIDDPTLRELLAYCFSYMELIDSLVGRAVRFLKERDLYDDTVIIFSADHGDMAGAHGFQSKGGYMYDEIYRIPLMVRVPGIERKRIKSPVNLMDITATITNLLSGEESHQMGNNDLHGSSLLPLIRGEQDSLRDVHYAEYHGDWYGHHTSRMVTDGTWKVVWNLGDLCELYDLKHDSGEMKNLFYNPDYRDIRDEYLEKLAREGKSYGDAHVYRTTQILPEVEEDLFKLLKNEFD